MRSGILKTNLSVEMSYKSFVPAKLPPNPPIEIDNEMLNLIVKANKQLAVLEEISARIPDMNLFVSMYVRKEALISSQIEGTQATLEDVLDPNIDENTNHNVADVINYIKATEFAIERLNELPISNRLICEAHSVLMQDVRGENKSPGEFRRSQNWIGGVGSTIQNARYIPPNVLDMTEAISGLEKYINGDDDLDVLIKTALIHYQFETIHPFLDGNGRMGRLLILLYLKEQKVLTTPALYVSYYLKKNRIEYYERLNEVRNNGNYEQWVKFFLQALLESATDAIENSDKLADLHNKNIVKIEQVGGRSSKTVLKLFTYIEANPIIDINKTATAIGMAYNTVSTAVNSLRELGILVQSEGKNRYRKFSYADYLNILKVGT